jgi:hypothetical protein
LCGEFVPVSPESPQNGAVVVETPDDNTVVRSKETVNQWLEEIERPLEFETLLELNEVISDLNLGGVSPEPEGKIRLVTTVEVNCPETMFATTNNSERVKNIEIQAIKKIVRSHCISRNREIGPRKGQGSVRKR